MNIKELVLIIEKKILEYKKKKLDVFITSSFQTHSIPMLHILSKIDNSIPVYFMNTGFHFPESIIFKNEIATLLDIEVIDLSSHIPKSQQLDSNNNFFFCSKPNYCCEINKIAPLKPILIEKDIWITGVRKTQSQHRNNFQTEQKSTNNVIRYHPMLEWDSKMIWEYRKKFNLPEHPLEKKGYLSIGCEPCTSKSYNDRDGRCDGLNKTECGLHTQL